MNFFAEKMTIVINRDCQKMGGWNFDPKIDQKWGGLHSLLEGSYCTVNPGDLEGPPPQNCRTDTETSWKKGPGLEQP
jgi:hypothetical protein